MVKRSGRLWIGYSRVASYSLYSKIATFLSDYQSQHLPTQRNLRGGRWKEVLSNIENWIKHLLKTVEIKMYIKTAAWVGTKYHGGILPKTSTVDLISKYLMSAFRKPGEICSNVLYDMICSSPSMLILIWRLLLKRLTLFHTFSYCA